MILQMRSIIHSLLWPSGRMTALYVMYYRKSAVLASILSKRHTSEVTCIVSGDEITCVSSIMPRAKKKKKHDGLQIG